MSPARREPDPTAEAREEYTGITGDLARVNAQLAHLRRTHGDLEDRHRMRADSLRKHLRDLRGSPTEDQYLDEVRSAHYARILGAKP